MISGAWDVGETRGPRPGDDRVENVLARRGVLWDLRQPCDGTWSVETFGVEIVGNPFGRGGNCLEQ
jgi:hypothetical protein